MSKFRERMNKDSKWINRLAYLTFALAFTGVFLSFVANRGSLELLGAIGKVITALGLLCMFIGCIGAVLSLALRHPSRNTLSDLNERLEKESD